MSSEDGGDDALFALNRQTYAQFEPLVCRADLVTRPLYSLRRGRTPERLGCGVLLEVGEASYLLTAAHVLLEVAEELNLGIGGATHIVRADGEAHYSMANPAAQSDDIARDVAVLRLSATCVDQLACPALSLSEVDSDSVLFERRMLMLVGFPIARRMNSFDPETRFIGHKSMRIAVVGADDAEYSAERIDQTRHVLSRFDRERAISATARVTTPALRGMSGCGAWMPTSAGKGALAGIFTEHHEDRSGLLVANRVSQHLELISEHFGMG